MADCEWAILCDYTFRDQAGKVCVIGIFDRMYALNVPATHPQAAIVLRFVGDAHEKLTFKLEIIRPTGGTIGGLQGNTELGDTGTADFNVNIGGLPIPDYGSYAFQLYINEQLSKTISFVVMKPDQATPPKGAAS